MIYGSCFECSNDATEKHHVVPKSLGGTRTVILCAHCHGLIHETKRTIKHSELTKAGIAKAKENGKPAGRRKGYEHSQETKDKIREAKLANAVEIDPVILNLAKERRAAGQTFQSIANELHELGAKTSRNGRINGGYVRRILIAS